MTDFESRLEAIEKRLDRLEFIDKKQREFELIDMADKIRWSLSHLEKRRSRGDQLSPEDLRAIEEFRDVLKRLEEVKI